MRRDLLLFSLLMLAMFAFQWGDAEAAAPGAPAGDGGAICVGQLARRDPDGCPPYGPGTTAARIASIRLPDPLPELAAIPLAASEPNVVPFMVAQVATDNAPVYAHPVEAAYGLPPKRRLGVGFVWVSVMAKTTYEGRDYYQINPAEYVPAEMLRVYQPSSFQGVALAEQPQRPGCRGRDGDHRAERVAHPAARKGRQEKASEDEYQRAAVLLLGHSEAHPVAPMGADGVFHGQDTG